MNTNLSAKFLAWGNSQPNDGPDGNYVMMRLPQYFYADVQYDYAGVCSSCLLDRSLRLRLDGLCEDSHIGENVWF